MRVIVGILIGAISAAAFGGTELSSSLTSLQLGKREIEFGTVIDVVADVGDDDRWWHRGNASDAIKLRVREMEGVEPDAGHPLGCMRLVS